MAFLTEKYTEHCYAALRIVSGFLFFWHGMNKLFSYPAAYVHNEPFFIRYTAGSIELICGALIAFGFLTRPAAFLSSGLMAFAYFIAIAPNALLPILSNGDLPVLYSFVFLFLSAKGSGILSIDSWRKS